MGRFEGARIDAEADRYGECGVSAPPNSSGPGRRFWIALGVSALALALVAALACGLLLFVLRDRLAGLVGDPVDSWEGAAAQTATITVYRPAYLPPGTGEPSLSISHPFEGVEEVRAMYGTGLVIVQSNAALEAEDPSEHQPASVEGAGEAYFVPGPVRTLVVDEGGTWVMLEGLPDAELLRIAQSLEPLPSSTVPLARTVGPSRWAQRVSDISNYGSAEWTI